MALRLFLLFVFSIETSPLSTLFLYSLNQSAVLVNALLLIEGVSRDVLHNCRTFARLEHNDSLAWLHKLTWQRNLIALAEHAATR